MLLLVLAAVFAANLGFCFIDYARNSGIPRPVTVIEAWCLAAGIVSCLLLEFT